MWFLAKCGQYYSQRCSLVSARHIAAFSFSYGNVLGLASAPASSFCRLKCFFEVLDSFGNLKCCRALCFQPEAGFRCSKCALVYRSRSSLELHFMFTHAEKVYHCPHCDAGFTVKEGLQLNLNRHLRKYLCKTCDKVFQSTTDLRRHEATHRDERPFVCSTCGVSFKNKVHMNGHRKLQHGSGSRLLCEHCGRVFQDAKNFAKHLKLHELHEDQLSKCERCNCMFASKMALNNHRKTCS